MFYGAYSVTHTMNRTNFDVLVCEPSLNYPRLFPENNRACNFDHVNHIKNDMLKIPGHPDHSWISREIGDLNLNLENMDINRKAQFRAPDTMRAGKWENPYINIITIQNKECALRSNYEYSSDSLINMVQILLKSIMVS